ncbi:relaxase MobL [Lactobacillus sp. ESL0233]|uniref:relaxase MobL n=1 Tax=Lactobacillus sp. ESL0233 TaxID=2069354 RepID=UPI002101816F|nr:relaxase MobL [Lactobacillus sp. ESL0233]
MKKLPAIILTSRFSTPTSHHAYGKYLGYIARKEALEAKEYLSEKEKKELAQVDERINSLNEKNNFEFKEQGNSDRQKSAQKILHEKEFYNLNDAEFDKYLGYMIRKEALNKKANEDGLNSEEREELVKVNTAAKKIGEVRSTKEKVLDGVFSSDKDLVQLKDMDYIRKQLNQAQKKGSVLWQDVISFDNEFLKKQKILDAQTGFLNEDEIQKATKKCKMYLKKKWIRH